MTDVAVTKAVEDMRVLLDSIKDTERHVKEMLHLESLKEPIAHAAISTVHNFEEHSKNPGWTTMEGTMMAATSGLDAGYSDELILDVMRKVLRIARVSASISHILRPLSEQQRDEVLKSFGAKLVSLDDDMPNVPREKMH